MCVCHVFQKCFRYGIYASSQGQRTHSARTKIQLYDRKWNFLQHREYNDNIIKYEILYPVWVGIVDKDIFKIEF